MTPSAPNAHSEICPYSAVGLNESLAFYPPDRAREYPPRQLDSPRTLLLWPGVVR
jgi:hypothetical protein